LLAPAVVYKSNTESGMAIVCVNACGDFKDMFLFLLAQVQHSFGESYLTSVGRLLYGAVEVIIGEENAREFITKVKKELAETLIQDLGKNITH